MTRAEQAVLEYEALEAAIKYSIDSYGVKGSWNEGEVEEQIAFAIGDKLPWNYTYRVEWQRDSYTQPAFELVIFERPAVDLLASLAG